MRRVMLPLSLGAVCVLSLLTGCTISDTLPNDRAPVARSRFLGPPEASSEANAPWGRGTVLGPRTYLGY